MPLIPVNVTSALPPGSVTEVQFGRESYAVCNVDGQFYCVDASCPHAGGPLAQGLLVDCFLTCPWHGWEFDCRTGETACAAGVKLATYPVLVRDGWVHVEVPLSGPDIVQAPALTAAGRQA